MTRRFPTCNHTIPSSADQQERHDDFSMRVALAGGHPCGEGGGLFVIQGFWKEDPRGEGGGFGGGCASELEPERQT